MSSRLTKNIVFVPFTRPRMPCASLPNSLADDFLQAGLNVGWLINCLYFRTFSPSSTAFTSSMSGLIGDASLYILVGVYYRPLACEAESKVRAAIDAHLDLTFLAGESLFTMMLLLFSAAASLAALFGGRTVRGVGSG